MGVREMGVGGAGSVVGMAAAEEVEGLGTVAVEICVHRARTLVDPDHWEALGGCLQCCCLEAWSLCGIQLG